MSIKIGNNNKIKNSKVGHEYNSSKEEKRFYERHSVLISVFISFFTGLILLFSFWKDFVHWVESFFK